MVGAIFYNLQLISATPGLVYEAMSSTPSMLLLETSRLILLRKFVTGPAKIDHVSAKNRQFLACLLYHNLITVYTTATKSSSLLQNFMGFLLQLTEMG